MLLEMYVLQMQNNATSVALQSGGQVDGRVATEDQIVEFQKIMRQSQYVEPVFDYLKRNNITHIDCSWIRDSNHANESCLYMWAQLGRKEWFGNAENEKFQLAYVYQMIKAGGGVTYDQATKFYGNFNVMLLASSTAADLWTRHLLQEPCLKLAWNTVSRDNETPLLNILRLASWNSIEHDTNASNITSVMSDAAINIKNTNGYNALCLSIDLGFLKTLRVLLSRPALKLEYYRNHIGHFSYEPFKDSKDSVEVISYEILRSSKRCEIVALFQEFFIPKINVGFGDSMHCPPPLVNIMFNYLYAV